MRANEHLAIPTPIPGAGVSGLTPHSPEVVLAQRLDRLHQLLYTRGGVRPVNAAVDELAKLLLLKLALRLRPNLPVDGALTLSDALDPVRLERVGDVDLVKRAFRLVNALPDFHAGAGSAARSVWPLDEPFRLNEPSVVAEAIRLILDLDVGGRQSGRALDPLGTAFDVFLQGRYDHSGGLGSYLTPASVATTMASIGLALTGPLDMGVGVVAGDPCCGTGRFLTALTQALSLTVDSTPKTIAKSLFGADQSTSAVAMAQVNMLSYGGGHAEIFAVNDSMTAGSVGVFADSLQLILTNPPFGEGKYDIEAGIEIASQWLPKLKGRKRIDPALAFVARSLDLLRDGGILGIVLPDGVVDSPALRALLLGGDGRVGIEAAISLPTSTFALSGTVAKTSALFVRKGASRGTSVYLASASHIGYLKQGGGAVVDPRGDDLPIIAEVIGADDGKGAELAILLDSPLVARAPRDTLFSLDPARLDRKAFAARLRVRGAGGCEVRSLAKVVKKSRDRQKLDGASFVSVLHVDDLGSIDWQAADAYSPTTPGIVAHAGHLIVSLLNPRVFRAAVVPEDRAVIECSSEFGVYETNCDPYSLLALLQSADARTQLAPLGRGTSSSRRRIDPEDVLDLLVPALTRSAMARLGMRVRDAQMLAATSRASLAAAYKLYQI